MPIVTGDLLYRRSGGASNTTPAASLGGAMSTVSGGIITSGTANDVWDDVTAPEAAAGDTEYRGLYLHNNHGSLTLQTSGIWIDSLTSSPDTEFDLGLGGAVDATLATTTQDTVVSTLATPSGTVGVDVIVLDQRLCVLVNDTLIYAKIIKRFSGKFFPHVEYTAAESPTIIYSAGRYARYAGHMADEFLWGTSAGGDYAGNEQNHPSGLAVASVMAPAIYEADWAHSPMTIGDTATGVTTFIGIGETDPLGRLHITKTAHSATITPAATAASRLARLRPMPTPRTTAMIMTRRVATRVIVRVTIASFHRPVPRMTASQTAVTTVGRQPPRKYAMASNTSAMSHQGEVAMSACSGLRNHTVTTSLKPLVKVSTASTNDRTTVLTTLASFGPLRNESTGTFSKEPNCARLR